AGGRPGRSGPIAPTVTKSRSRLQRLCLRPRAATERARKASSGYSANAELCQPTMTIGGKSRKLRWDKPGPEVLAKSSSGSKIGCLPSAGDCRVALADSPIYLAAALAPAATAGRNSKRVPVGE